MSSPEVAAPAVIEPTVAPTAELTTSSPADVVAETPAAAVDQPTTEVAGTDAAAPAAVESAPDAKVAEATKPEDKKEKKQGRKPFADLLNKILKPNPQEKPAPEKKPEAEAVEEVAPEAAAPVVDAPAVEATTAEVPEVADAPAEAAPAEDATKDLTTPRKERGNIFEKFTAFVLKPKSPKCKKADAPKEGEDEVTPDEAPVAEVIPEAQPVEEAAPTSPQAPTSEAVETPAVEAAVSTETPEQVKVEKKEKTPKDLAKMARRFSGRLFGADKKKESSKKPEPTEEEAQAAAQSENPAENVAVSDVAPQIPADPTPEVSQSTADPAPVIAAAA